MDAYTPSGVCGATGVLATSCGAAEVVEWAAVTSVKALQSLEGRTVG
jgi:hypothetical protein